MKIQPFASALALFVLSFATVSAADLSKIERAITKEPVYQSKAVKYCLLVFGPEAKNRVWLVLDGDMLYVDRNGNGDLTEEGEKVAVEKKDRNPSDGNTFEAGDIHEGERMHKKMEVSVFPLAPYVDQSKSIKELLAKDPQTQGFTISIQMALPGWKGNGVGGRVTQQASIFDITGALQFADRLQHAPIIHFGGSLHVTFYSEPQLRTGRETDMVLAVGTLGVGPGTTAYINYAGVIPESALPVVEVTYPPKTSGDPPMRERYQLKDRC